MGSFGDSRYCYLVFACVVVLIQMTICENYHDFHFVSLL
jgi:hypothetical protein